MSEITAPLPSLEDLIPPPREPEFPTLSAEQQPRDWRTIRRRAGKIALGLAITAGGLGVAGARAAESVEHMPPTKVPISVAGARVTAELEPGADTMRVVAMGEGLVHPIDLTFHRKHYGLTVNFDTATKAASLLTPSGKLDEKKLDHLFTQFSDTTPQSEEIKSALQQDIYGHAGVAGGETLAIELGLVGLFGLLRYRRRNYTPEQRQQAAHDQRPIAITAALALSAAGIVPVVHASRYYWAPNHHEAVIANPAFTGTALEGWEIDGPFSGLVDVGIRKWDEDRRKKNAFYDAELVNFNQALLAKYASLHVAKPSHTKRIIFADDFQGIDGTTRIVGAAAKAFNADVIAIGGDTEDSNLPFISVLDNLRENAKGVPVVMATGIHDPANISQLARSHGFHIADGTMQVVGGIRFLPVADANSLAILADQKSQVHPGISEDDVTKKAISTVCSSKQPAIVLLHDHAMGTPIAETNCAATVLQGRSYFPPTPTDYGNTVAVTSDTTGGHYFGEGINLSGIIAAKASFKIIDVNEQTLQFEDMTTITMDPVPQAGGDTSTESTAVAISDILYRSQLIQAAGDTRQKHSTLASAKR